MDHILYFPILPDPDEVGSERSNDVRQWTENFLMPACLATDEEDKVRLDFVKTRNAPEYIQSIYLRLDRQNMRFALIRGDGSSLLSIDDDIIEMLKTGGSISEGHILSGIKNLHMNVKLNIAHIRDSLNNLVMSGKLERQQGMVWIKPDIVSSGSDWELDNSSED